MKSPLQWVILWDGPDQVDVFGTKGGRPFASEAAAEQYLRDAGHEDDGQWRIALICLGSQIPSEPTDA